MGRSVLAPYACLSCPSLPKTRACRLPATCSHAPCTPATPRAPPPAGAAAAASPSLLLTASAAASAQTMRIRQINHEAQRNDSVGERVGHWKAWFREKGEQAVAGSLVWLVWLGCQVGACWPHRRIGDGGGAGFGST